MGKTGLSDALWRWSCACYPTAAFHAEEVARLLEGAGLNVPLAIAWVSGESEADGIDDWRSRRVTIVLEP